MFTDIATIKVIAGKGGDGNLSFYRTRGNAKGGPDGGDGGRGGDIILRASHNTNSLSKYRTSKLWSAKAGMPGGTNNRHGKKGEDIILNVPPGTVIKQDDTILADLDSDTAQIIIAKGGSGGFGNAHFKTSVRRSPQLAELGEDGEQKELTMELKMLADVGLIGLPNAGKSTLLSVVSGAKPEIANYPFTTLVPNIGVVDIGDSSFLLADIPGLIAGASAGKGLGMEFLRHVERCKLLVHLIDINSDDIYADYLTIREELSSYQIDLSKRESIVVLTKIDSKTPAQITKLRETLANKTGISQVKIHTISAIAHKNTQKLLFFITREIKKVKPTKKLKQPKTPVITLHDDSSTWNIQKEGEIFIITGEKIEKFANRTNFSQPDGVRRLKDILKRSGIFAEVTKLGGTPGSTLSIAGKELKW